MQTAVIKRSIVLDGHKTSVSLENEFWLGLREIAGLENTPLSMLVGKIDRERNSCNLSSAIRVYVFNYFRAQIGRQVNSQQNSQAHLDADVPLAIRQEMAS
jgi:predicted DNA-binding ribbon-helix-helix protein